MREHPILFQGDMVRAILEGRKTQTRRVVKGGLQTNRYAFVGLKDELGYPASEDNLWAGFQRHDSLSTIYYKCPYGQVGDRLIVKETHYKYGRWVPSIAEPGWLFKLLTTEVLYCDNPPAEVLPNSRRLTTGWFKRPSIHMFRKYSRISLEITEVRVERVQEIGVGDCIAEGILKNYWNDVVQALSSKSTDNLIKEFQELWDSINAKRGYGWSVNPWVWVVSFKKV